MKKESKSYFFRIVKRTYEDNSFKFFVQRKSKEMENTEWEEEPYPYDKLVAAEAVIEVQIKLDTPKKVINEKVI